MPWAGVGFLALKRWRARSITVRWKLPPARVALRGRALPISGNIWPHRSPALAPFIGVSGTASHICPR